MSRDKLSAAEAVAILLECGISPVDVFDVREELNNPPPTVDAAAEVLACQQSVELHSPGLG